jgi:hypothetical protein
VHASNYSEVLGTWRSLGVPFHSLHKSKPRSVGQLASQLTYILTLRRQLEEQTPFLYVLEDDVKINSTRQAALFRKAACVGARQLMHGARYPGRTRTGLVTMGGLSEAFMTSLGGARDLLTAYCTRGIVDNKDYQNIFAPSALKFAGGDECSWSILASNPGSGLIKWLPNDLDPVALREESRMSAAGQSGWCREFLHAAAAEPKQHMAPANTGDEKTS